MKVARSYSWFVLLGGVVGCAIGMVLVFMIFNASSAWERQIYINNSASTDPAVELIGYDDQTQFLYVRGQSQKVYFCPVRWYSDTSATSCYKTQPSIAEKLGDSSPCKFRIFPTPHPPGNILSSLEAHPCSDDANVQVNWVILSDNSIWRSLQGSGGAGESLAELFALVSATVGTILGLIIGFIISRIVRRRSAA